MEIARDDRLRASAGRRALHAPRHPVARLLGGLAARHGPAARHDGRDRAELGRRRRGQPRAAVSADSKRPGGLADPGRGHAAVRAEHVDGRRRRRRVARETRRRIGEERDGAGERVACEGACARPPSPRRRRSRGRSCRAAQARRARAPCARSARSPSRRRRARAVARRAARTRPGRRSCRAARSAAQPSRSPVARAAPSRGGGRARARPRRRPPRRRSRSASRTAGACSDRRAGAPPASGLRRLR